LQVNANATRENRDVIVGAHVTQETRGRLRALAIREDQTVAASGRTRTRRARRAGRLMSFGTIGSPEKPSRPTVEALRATRVAQARTKTRWREIQPPVKRGPFYVDAETDQLLAIYRGALYDRAGVVRFAADRSDLCFAVDAGDVTVYAPSTVARTWSDIVARRAKAGAR
jgi:hypothetical protein